MENKCKRLAVFPTNHTHKTLVSLNDQTLYGTGSLTEYKGLLPFIYFLFGGFGGWRRMSLKKEIMKKICESEGKSVSEKLREMIRGEL